MPWQPLPLSYAVAIYPFQPSASSAELPLQIGDQLYVIEQGGKDGAWCRGYLVAPPNLLSALTPGGRTAADARVFSGIFPKCCIEIREQLGPGEQPVAQTGQPKPQAPLPMLKVGDESPTSSSEPLVDEISSCLREWYILHLPDLVLRREYHLLDQMSNVTRRLDYARRELLNDVLTTQERLQVRSQAVWDLLRGNKMLSGDIIVRDANQHGRLLASDDSAIEMTKSQAVMSVLDAPPSENSKAILLHHCLLDVKSVVGSDQDAATLSMALYRRDSAAAAVPVSETYSSVASAKMKTLFSDLSTRDLADDNGLFLAIKLVLPEPPRMAKKRTAERPPSRNGTLMGQRQLSLNRRRSSLMFGKKKHGDRPQPGQNGRATPQFQDRVQTPSILEEEEDGSTQTQGPPVPRTVGVGVLDVDKIMAGGQSCEEAVTIWSLSSGDDEKGREIDKRIAQLLNSQGKSIIVSPQLSSITLSLTPFTAPDADALIKNNATLMHLVTKTPKMGFSEAPSKPRTDIYLRLNKATITPGALLSHPDLNVAPIKAAWMQNLQLTMEVRDGFGRRVEHCINPSSNGAGVTAFRTNAVELDGAWDQTLCLRIPTEKVPESHLVLSIADAPEFPFGLAWMPLWDKQAFISDGKHSLILHAYDKITSSIVHGRGAYLSLPWNNESYRTVHEGSFANIASLEVHTLLCSTEYSQDRTLVSLINWKHQTSVQLLDILQKLTFVPEIEVVKQLNDVLDALFGVLVHKTGESKFEDLIFNDIVWVLGIVHDRRYNLGPLVEQYTESHFRSPYAASCLIRSFTRLLQSVSDPQSARDMRALFKVGRTFMKIVITSNQQRRFGSQSNTTGDKRSDFKEDMQAILFGLQMMMRSETAALVGSKTLLVQKFHTWLPELLPAFSKEEVMESAVEFIDACDEATGKLVLYRLLLILNYTKMDQVWVDDKDKKILVKNCVRWLSPYWSTNNLTNDWHEQVRLCCSIVAELTRFPTHYLHEFTPKLISAYEIIAQEPRTKRRSLSLLFPGTYPFVTKPAETNDQFDETLLELSALVATISKLKAPTPRLQGHDLSKYVLSTLSVLRLLLQNNACPSTWLSLHIYHHSSALTILNNLSSLLIAQYLPSPEEAENPDHADEFNLKMSLWKSFLDTLVMLVSSPDLALELFPEQKRRAVWKIAGDVRQSGADLLRRCWESLGWEATPDDQRRYNIRRLGGYQVQYVPSLVAPTIRLCLSMHEGLRKVAVEILQAMIINEWALSDGESLELIETEVIGALNSVLKARPVTANEAMSRKIFIAELLDLFATIANQPDDALWTAIEDLVATIDELVDLLTSMDAEDEFEARTNGHGHTAATATTHGKDGTEGTGRDTDSRSQDSEGKEMARARRSIDGLSPSSPQQGGRSGEREYGVHALECYKQLAEEYERSGDYKRLAKTHRAIARIHEVRAASRLGHHGAASGGLNGRGGLYEDGEEDGD
ncbi:Deoxycytidine kinase 1 [Elasticomyces elasticus]|uniref:Deoxycytidine kinase 1 n=1 Tax=Exophiala sideris TaxID=1016849 RepID=A0ABR0JQI5_9EURO|nr:Deoxycytidine kinase 1 [Elasticomyces elasticus]KAK5039850.1 Deoxycytidine kinase 1 [Exophiala sideris]KAK5041402.1 Deoxycytidine kinase 1 [Exophiala sideris]KAK5068229.1 Deoxycytidine kinase 1 [Exophiala sideris]KAK5187530.1 Deoxycytidine kinase 1 [Eurotiomycetes sp. CCFEE 6388]